MNTRRKFLSFGGAALCALVASRVSLAQQGKVWRIGFLGPTSAAGIAARLEAFRAGLRELGYVEGMNLVVEYRWAEGSYDRLPGLAADLVRLKVDLIVTHSAVGARAAKQATTTIPIIFAPVGDAVASGLVSNLARPGGNLTGLSFFTPELNAKRLELLKGAFPQFRRVGFLFNANNPAAPIKEVEAAATSLKMELQLFGVRGPGELESALAAMGRQRIEAAAIVDDPMLIGHARSIADIAVKQRLPSIGFLEMAEAGGLFAYGVNLPALARRAAFYVDKVLKGTKPGDLPVERATAFELIVNLKTAKAIGLKIPQDLLFRADKVIE